MSNQQVKSLRKSNEELKKLLNSARRDIKSLEERVGAQELFVRGGQLMADGKPNWRLKGA